VNWCQQLSVGTIKRGCNSFRAIKMGLMLQLAQKPF
jgi:hypothetical protein